MDEDQEPEMKKIIKLANREWLTREELADHLDVSPRTLSSMIHRGDVERRETSDGVRYRYCGSDSEERQKKSPAPPAPSEQAPHQEPSPTQVVSVAFKEWTSTTEALARREIKLLSAREDVRRAVEYAQQLEEECDRLADEANQTRQRVGQLRSEVDREKGRRQQLEEQYQFVLGELEQMGGLRARYHLERGRREQADQKIEEMTDELHQINRHIDKLTAALKEAEERGFKAAIGPLTVEIKR